VNSWGHFLAPSKLKFAQFAFHALG
jgi:hypothetical protein